MQGTLSSAQSLLVLATSAVGFGYLSGDCSSAGWLRSSRAYSRPWKLPG